MTKIGKKKGPQKGPVPLITECLSEAHVAVAQTGDEALDASVSPSVNGPLDVLSMYHCVLNSGLLNSLCFFLCVI